MRVFIEEQRFTQKWLIILLSISGIIPMVIISNLYFKGNMSFTEYLGVIVLVLTSIGLIFIFKLKTKIDETGIHYQFFPFHLKMKTILWMDIKFAETRTYDALLEYGGWGLKGGILWNKNKGIAINVKGEIGIQLVLNNNKKILIGTQKKQYADSVIARYLHKI